MKLTGILILATCLHLSASGVGQSVTLSLKDAPLEKIFTEIIRQSGKSIIYNDASLKNARPVTIEVKNATPQEVLDLSLKGQPFSYAQEDGYIIVKPTPTPDLSQGLGKKELSPSISSSLTPPPITVKGRIVNENGEPVAASVVIKGTNYGVTTGSYGNFELKNVDDNAVLIISGVTIEKQEVKIGGRSEITITVMTKIGAEEEVVINAGYYTTTDKKRTGNIGKVTSKDIERQPVTSPLMALQGRVAGVDIVPGSGIAGTGAKIQIRGQNSLRNTTSDDGNFPLYIVDGVPIDSRPLSSVNPTVKFSNGIDPISTINPANIESIEILKDADATAIYGSRGANGVILVTTKKGRLSGSTNFDVTFYQGIGKMEDKVDILNAKEYLMLRNEAFRNANASVRPTDWDLNGAWDTTRSTDWQKELLGKSANITDVQANISWGGAKTSFRLGGGVHKESTIYPGDFGYQRANGNFSLTHRSDNDKFSAALTINYGSDKNKFFRNNDLVTRALDLPPVAPSLYGENGELNWQIDTLFGNLVSTFENPLSYLRNTGFSLTNNLIANANVCYTIVKGIFISSGFGYSDLSSEEQYINPLSSLNPLSINSATTASATFGYNKRRSWIIEPKVSYNKSIDKHSLDITIGSTIQEIKNSFQSIQADGYISDALLGSIIGATSTTFIEDRFAQYNYISIFGRVGYDYAGKYLLNITGRRDGSSRFGPGKQFGNFGAIGAGWIFSSEKLIEQSIPFLSFGKIRASYGVTGNDQIPDYGFYDTYNSVGLYDGGMAISPTALFNPNFAWEETKKLETGIQLGFIKDRLNLEVSWYKNRSSNQLIQYALPSTTGFPSLKVFNSPATVQNTGVEVLMRFDVFKSGNFNWTTSINVTFPRNKLISYSDIAQSPYSTIYKVGEPLSVKRVYEYTGVDPNTGFYTVKDINNDGSIDDSDYMLMNIGKRQQYGGFNNDFSIGNFRLSFLLQFVKQDVPAFTFTPIGSARSNQFKDVLNRWQKPGDITDQQMVTRSFSSLFSYLDYSSSNAIYEDASFVRLKALSLSYSVPQKILNTAGLKEASLFVQGQNIFTGTKFKRGLDPETVAALPPLRIISIGISAKL